MASEIESIAAVSRGWFGLLKKNVHSHSCILQKHPHSLIFHNRIIIILCFYRAHTGRRPKTFWSWWCLAQPALLFQTMCSALIAQNHAALQKLLLRAFSTTPQRSCLAKLWTSTLTSQRSVSSYDNYFHRICSINIILLTGIIWFYRHQS